MHIITIQEEKKDIIFKRIIMASSEVNDTNRWECRKCTFLNSIAAYPKCMLCDHSDCSLTNTSTVRYVYIC